LRRAVGAAQSYEIASLESAEAERMRDLVIPYAASVKRTLARDNLREAQTQRVITGQHHDQARAIADDAHATWEAQRFAAAKVGGADAHQLRSRLNEAQQREREVADAWGRLASRLTEVGVTAPNGATEFAELVAAARREIDQPPPARIAHELYDAHSVARRDVAALEKEIAELRHRKSNI